MNFENRENKLDKFLCSYFERYEDLNIYVQNVYSSIERSLYNRSSYSMIKNQELIKKCFSNDVFELSNEEREKIVDILLNHLASLGFKVYFRPGKEDDIGTFEQLKKEFIKKNKEKDLYY